jgi:hypothetical protein
VGPTAGLDTEATEKTIAFAGDRTPVVQSVVRHCVSYNYGRARHRSLLTPPRWKDDRISSRNILLDLN